MRGLSLLSSGIDSPVASYLMLHRGIELEYIHFYFGDKSLSKAKRLVRVLGGKRLFALPHNVIKKKYLNF